MWSRKINKSAYLFSTVDNLGNAIKQLTIYIDQMNSYDAKITMKCVLKKNVPLGKCLHYDIK